MRKLAILLTLVACAVLWYPASEHAPNPARAATSYVQDGGGEDFGASTVGAPMATTASGNLLACMIYWSSNTITLTSVTDGTNAHNLSHNPTTLGSVRAALSYVENITGLTTPTITATFSGSPGIVSIGCHEVDGTETSGALDQATLVADDGTGADSITTGNVTTNTDGQYVFGGANAVFTTEAAAGTNFTLRSGSVGSNQPYTESRVQVAAGAIAATFTPAGADNWLVGMMTFKESGAPPPAPSSGRRLLMLGVGDEW
jgi:hypothetical protein